MIVWDEPYHYGDGPQDWINVKRSVTEEDAIRWMKYRSNFNYHSDEQALNDFMVTHFAYRTGET